MNDHENTKNEKWTIENTLTTQTDKQLLQSLVIEKKNLLITGLANSGKTTLLSWITNFIDTEERVLLFDFRSEVSTKKQLVKKIKIGYAKDSDIVGDASILELKTLIEKAILLPYDRIIADELYGAGTEKLLHTLYGTRSIILSIESNSGINALKKLYLSTIYPDGKELNQNQIDEITKTFDYVITLGEKMKIEKIKKQDNLIVLEEIN